MAAGVPGALRDIGPAIVTYDASDYNSFGDVVINYAEDTVEVFEGEFGSTPVDLVVTGAQCSVVVPLSRTQLDELADFITAGTYAGGVPNIDVDAPVGVAASTDMNPLIIQPNVNRVISGDADEYITFPLTWPVPDFAVAYNSTAQRVFNVTFRVFPDATSGLLFHIGAVTP